MTTIFIISVFALIVIYDVIVALTKRETITAVFRVWYNQKPIVPFMVGVVFIGHFQTLLEVSNIPFFLIASCMYMVWCLLNSETSLKIYNKFYLLNCKYFFIPMIIGTIIGSFWRTA